MFSTLDYLAKNTFELLFITAASVLLYSLVRRFGMRPLFALVFATLPLVTIWAYRDALGGGMMIGLF